MLLVSQRMLLLPGALLALSLLQVHGAVLDARQSPSSTLPAPIVFSPDQNWDGIDGSWSSFTLRVGTPQQFVRTFVSFSSYQTWVVLPEGCDAAVSQASCVNQRGWTFSENASSTFVNQGIYDLWIERNLGYYGNAIYGFDTVGLGGVGEGGPTIKNTTVGGMAVETYYLGIFGINPKPTNWSSFDEGSPSYMTLLKEQSLIPSLSFGYSAGAQYRNTGELASLTLGGYDESKYVPNDVTFTFAADNERDIVVSIQSISTDLQSQGQGQQLLPTPVYAYVDSTVPQIWLPLSACQAFENAFGIEYDNATGLYLVNDSLHNTLTQQNPNVTFTLSMGPTGGPSVNITLPYAAFDLTAQPPYQGLPNSSYYFPLRRAENDTQHTLGRTFLQEAYIAVDYEAQRFNISQMTWTNAGAPSHIVAIPPYTEQFSTGGFSGSGSDSSSSNNGLSKGAIAGIVVGSVAAISLSALVIIWHFCWRQRGRQRLNEKNEPEHDPNASTVYPRAELEGSSAIRPLNGIYIDRHGLPTPNGSRGEYSSSGSTGPGSTTPVTPLSPNAPLSSGHYFHTFDGSNNSPTTPSGEGTHSSTQSGSGNNTLVSPMTASGTSEADSRERHIYEMPGDMPTIREKDGKALSEKEALRHREREYNGVDSSASSNYDSTDGSRAPRRVSPDEVVKMDQIIGLADGGDGSSWRGGSRPGSAVFGGPQHARFSFELHDRKREDAEMHE